jgi:hypothetical protein
VDIEIESRLEHCIFYNSQMVFLRPRRILGQYLEIEPNLSIPSFIIILTSFATFTICVAL